jgi:hypothetical protein
MATTGPLPLTLPFTPGQEVAPVVRCYLSTDDVSVSTPNWANVSADIRSYSVRRGRNSEFNAFDAGTATVVLDNRDRSYDPTVNAAIRPMNRIWLFEEFSGEVHSLFKGYAASYEQNYDRSGVVDATATVQAVDQNKPLNFDSLPTSGTIASAASDVQLGALLDLSSTPSRTAPRRTQTGNPKTAQAIPLGGEATLGVIQNLMQAELPDGVWFVAADGTLTMLPWNQRSTSPYDTVQAIFGDAGGSELPYLACSLDYSDSFLINEVVVTRTGGSPQTSSDATSIASYGKRSVSFSSVPIEPDDSAAGVIANNILANRKQPFLRVISISPNLNDPNTAQAVFRRELMDRIRVLRTPPGGGARIDQTAFIQSIEFSGTPGMPPSCTLGVSPL